MCTQTCCNLNFKGKQPQRQVKGCFLATEQLTKFFFLKMSENLCKLHRDLDKYYSQNYLSSWCGHVKIGKKHALKRLDQFIFKSYVLAHSLIRGVLIQSCPARAKNFTNYVFCHVQFNSPGQSSKNHCAIKAKF